MKKILITCFTLMLICGLTGCHRKEIRVAEFQVPAMKSETAVNYIRERIKGLGQGQGQVAPIKSIDADLASNTLIVTYNSNHLRTMNIEDAIAKVGFAVNHRPADPAAEQKLPKEVKQ